MKNIKRAALCLLLGAMLLVCGCMPAFSAVAANFAGANAKTLPLGEARLSAKAEHARIPFDKIEYKRPDLEESYRLIESVRTLIGGSDSDALFQEYDKLLKQYEHIFTMIVFADINYDLDLNNSFYANEIAQLEKDANAFLIQMDAVTAEILSSAHGDAARKRWDEGFVRIADRNAAADGKSLAILSLRESAYEQEYYQASVGFTVSYQGREWTIGDIYMDATLSYGEYIELYRRYCDDLAETLEPMFKDLVGTRARIAEAAGYGNYSDYAYAMYARDYTPKDAKAFYGAVKDYVVPLYLDLFDRYSAADYEALHAQRFELWDTLERFQTLAGEFSPRLKEAFSYMLDYGMCDLWPSRNKIGGGYVTLLPEYASPFLLMNWDESYQSVTTLIHEMGHYLSYYDRPVSGYNSADPMDLAEVESQALELLFLEYYDELFNAPDAARLSAIGNALYALISGCMEDEFQQRVYAEPDMEYERMSALYYELAKDYGLTEIYDVPPTSWVVIPHTFTSPLYYFSYAISTVPSLEIFQKSLTDYSAARSMYFALERRGEYVTFRKALSDANLSDPFSPELLKGLCADLRAYLDKLPAGAEGAPAFAPRKVFADGSLCTLAGGLL
ncbi:MAG: M3 family metallopeptidase [Bacillota bacterium]